VGRPNSHWFERLDAMDVRCTVKVPAPVISCVIGRVLKIITHRNTQVFALVRRCNPRTCHFITDLLYLIIKIVSRMMNSIFMVSSYFILDFY